jgi:hypothetical protein
MGELVGFPADRAAVPRLERLRCEECGGAPMIFVPVVAAGSGARSGQAVTVLHAYCSPLCAAGCGVAPWDSADLAERGAWRSRAELVAEGGA